MLSKTTSDDTVTREALNYMKIRLENRNYSITKRNFPIRYGVGCFVTKNFMELPYPENLSIDEIRKLYAFQIHESAHILFSSLDFKRCEKVIKEEKLDISIAKDILNIIEDYRVNTLISVSHPGAGRLMNSIHQDMINDGRVFDTTLKTLLPYLCGYNLTMHLSRSEKKKLNKAADLIRPVIKSKDLSASLKVLPKVYDIFAERLTDKDIQHAKEWDGYEFDDKDLETGVLTKAQVQKNIDKVVKKLEKKLIDSKLGTPTKVKGGTTVDAKPPLSKVLIDTTVDEEDLEKLCTEVKKINKKAFTEEEKDFADIDKIELKKYSLVHETPRIGSESEYSETSRKYNREVNQLVREMKKLIVFGKRWSTGERTGKLNSKKAYKYITNGDTRIFKKKNAKDVGNVAVLLFVDCSGSMMRGDRMVEARKTAIVLHEVLRKLKLKHMIVGYTADEGGYGVNHIVYKTWNDKKTCYDLTKLIPRRENRDGETIRAGIHYFKNILEKKKVMIVISDGVPGAGSYSGSFAIEDTVNAQKETKKKGIKIINIGAGTGYKMPENYINKVKVDNFADLPKRLLMVLRKELRN